jgi:hypothetical protein
MLMIVHRTPNELDSFVWIVPIIIAILIRPYIVRYIHQIHYKVYREISIVSFFLLFGALGCFICGWSCQITGKNKVLFLLIRPFGGFWSVR